MAADTTGALTPTARPRRSFVYRLLVDAGASFVEINGGAVAATLGGEAEAEAAQAREMALVDLSPLPRIGFKGRSALDWIRRQGFEIGDDDNRAYPTDDGALIARLAPNEALILGDDGVAGESCQRLADTWSMEGADGAYLVPRQGTNFWFMITGRHAPTMFAKICGVDLRPATFPNHQIAQTSIARINAIVIRDDIGDMPAFHLVGDSASAVYMWGCLIDAMAEFKGNPVGYLSLGINSSS